MPKIIFYAKKNKKLPTECKSRRQIGWPSIAEIHRNIDVDPREVINRFSNKNQKIKMYNFSCKSYT